MTEAPLQETERDIRPSCETLLDRLRRLEAECCRCLKCDHVQAEPNWCHRCGHRTTTPDWAKELLGEREAANEAHEKAEDAIREVQRVAEAYWSGDA